MRNFKGLDFKNKKIKSSPKTLNRVPETSNVNEMLMKMTAKIKSGTRLLVLGLDWDSILPLQLLDNEVGLDVLDFLGVFGKNEKTLFNPIYIGGKRC